MGNDSSRRSFFSRVSASLAAFAAGTATAGAQTPVPFRPRRHPEDDWYDTLPGSHRIFLDSVSALGVGEALGFASNTFTANKSGYNLDDGDLAVIVCLRHRATHFAFSDAIWAKYGVALGADLGFDDPKTKKAPVINVYNTTGYDQALPNRNISLAALTKRSVHYAVCGLSVRRISGVVARAHNISVDEAFKELSSNLVPNGHLVAAGVVAVNRAQERGYSLLFVG